MLCDKNSSKHNKGTSSSEVKTKAVYFMHESSILVSWINGWRPSIFLWLSLRLGEGIMKVQLASNSAIDFSWIMKLPRVHDAQWIVLSLFTGVLNHFKGIEARYHLRFLLWPSHSTLLSGPCQVFAGLSGSRYSQDGSSFASYKIKTWNPIRASFYFLEMATFCCCMVSVC